MYILYTVNYRPLWPRSIPLKRIRKYSWVRQEHWPWAGYNKDVDVGRRMCRKRWHETRLCWWRWSGGL